MMNNEINKAKAKALRVFLGNHGIALKHSLALEAIARIEGKPSYNVLQATPAKNSPGPLVPTWDIEVSRIGYGCITILVKNVATQKEAEALALDEAGDHSVSEHHSDYKIVGAESEEEAAVCGQSEVVMDTGASVPGDWEVEVCCITYGTRMLKIAGVPTRAEAEEQALDHAGELYYPAQNREYEVNGSRRL